MIAQTLAWHKARPRLAVSFHAPVCLTLLGFALISQYGFGLHPCVLCLWQRVPYSVIAVAALASLALDRKWTPWFLGAFAAIYLTEAGIAFFHTGVEAGWWKGTAGCGFQSNKGSDIADLYAQIQSAPLTSCKDVAWRLFGLSMAGWNVIVALGLTALSGLQALVQASWWTARK